MTNKARKKKYFPLIMIVSIVAVVAVSGCVAQDLFGGIFGKVGEIFGMEVIKPSREVQVVGTTNPLAVDKVWTLPESRVFPEAPVQLFMELSNKDNDPTKTIFASVDIFDAGVMKDSSGTAYCNSYSMPKARGQCGPEPSECALGSTAGCQLKVGATKQITFDMRAPTEKEIANVITKTKLNYKVVYHYKGATNFEVLVVDYNEIIRRQKEGKTLSTNLIDSKSSGPIKIDVELGAPYVISVTAGQPSPIAVSPKAYLRFKLRNAGAGSLVESEILPDDFVIYLPKDFAVSSGNIALPSEEFACNDDEQDIECRNIFPIKFFRQESEPFQFVVNNIKDLPAGTPYKTALIRTEVKYNYELRGSAEVTINPLMK